MKLVQCSGVFLARRASWRLRRKRFLFRSPAFGRSRSHCANERKRNPYFPRKPRRRWPLCRPGRGKNEEFYGTTFAGGNTPSGGLGTVFEISSAGKEKVLYSFQGGNDGLAPQAGLIVDSVGNLYGDTAYGGGSLPAPTVAEQSLR